MYKTATLPTELRVIVLARVESNHRPLVYQTSTLTPELLASDSRSGTRTPKHRILSTVGLPFASSGHLGQWGAPPDFTQAVSTDRWLHPSSSSTPGRIRTYTVLVLSQLPPASWATRAWEPMAGLHRPCGLCSAGALQLIYTGTSGHRLSLGGWTRTSDPVLPGHVGYQLPHPQIIGIRKSTL